jgi:hypothetical protein
VNLERRIAALDAATRPIGGVAVISIRHDASSDARYAAIEAWRVQRPGPEPGLVVFIRKFTDSFLAEGTHG